MDPLPTEIDVTYAAQLAEGYVGSAFDVAAARLDLRHLRRANLRTRAYDNGAFPAFATPLELLASADTQHGARIWMTQTATGELVELTQHTGYSQVRVATPTPAAADALLAAVLADVRAEEAAADPRIPIWFWTSSEHGPQPMRRKLHAPAWEDIAGNYAPPVRDALARIVATDPAELNGIALWRGAPGTGKTTALRALARAWQGTADVHVILDPEVFLGDKASYLVNVLFGDTVDEYWGGEEEDEGDGTFTQNIVAFSSGAVEDMAGMQLAHEAAAFGAMARRRGPRPKLVVLEDAGELISSDARVSSGQALSRLLNLTDGMLGQGSNVSVLVTTNEPVERLHPAIARPGRGWAHVAFPEFGRDDAREWLVEHGMPDAEAVVETDQSSLAELYARLRGDQIVALDALAD